MYWNVAKIRSENVNGGPTAFTKAQNLEGKILHSKVCQSSECVSNFDFAENYSNNWLNSNFHNKKV